VPRRTGALPARRPFVPSRGPPWPEGRGRENPRGKQGSQRLRTLDPRRAGRGRPPDPPPRSALPRPLSRPPRGRSPPG